MSTDTLFDPADVRTRTAEVAATLPAVEWITDNRVERLSQDFYWFSPVLKRQLEGLRAARAADVAEATSIMAQLVPLLEKARDLPEGEDA